MKRILLLIGLVVVTAVTWKVTGFFTKSPVVLSHEIGRPTSVPPTLTIEPNSEDRIVVKEAFEATNGYLLVHHDRYPLASHWEQAISPFWNKNIPFSVALTGQRRLAMNISLSGKQISKLDTSDNTILFYETKARSQNANGFPPHISLHQTIGTIPVIVCVDGHSVNE